MKEVIQYYVDTVRNPEAAIAFLETRAKITPDEGELVYTLASLHGMLNHRDEALKYLAQAIKTGGENSVLAARIDPHFEAMRDDPRFQALLGTNLPPSVPATNAPTPASNAAPGKLVKPKQK